jgi:hypothetical protein
VHVRNCRQEKEIVLEIQHHSSAGQAMHRPPEAAAHEESDEPPDEYVCPITLQLMRDPVVLSDGHSYEKSALVDWLENKDTSPKTNEILEHKHFFTNHNLTKAISRFREKYGDDYDSIPRYCILVESTATFTSYQHLASFQLKVSTKIRFRDLLKCFPI